MACTDFVLAEYIWIGGKGELRSKTKVIHGKKSVVLADLSNWNYDGSSTEQAPGEDSEVILEPRAVYADPFRRTGKNVLVLCDTYDPSGKAIPTNSRSVAAEVFDQAPKEEPWFGIEQEYTLFQDGRPLGFPKSDARTFKNSPLLQFGFPGPQGPYYCSAGADRAFGRDLVEMHLEYCLYAGLTLSGINAEVMPGQWEYQVGPCTGIQSGDMMTVSRYILHRVGEKFGVTASFDPKPVPGDWNGAGCHTNFSTAKMRAKNGLKKAIYPALEKLGLRHEQHIAAYGEGNADRLTGKHETAGIDKFSYGVADRGSSVRIPNVTATEGKGYFEDRRPAANMDPYVVTSLIFDTSILNGKCADKFAALKVGGVDLGEIGLQPLNYKETKQAKRKASKTKPPKIEKELGSVAKQSVKKSKKKVQPANVEAKVPKKKGCTIF